VPQGIEIQEENMALQKDVILEKLRGKKDLTDRELRDLQSAMDRVETPKASSSHHDTTSHHHTSAFAQVHEEAPEE
jgi:hypothetical protein